MSALAHSALYLFEMGCALAVLLLLFSLIGFYERKAAQAGRPWNPYTAVGFLLIFVLLGGAALLVINLFRDFWPTLVAAGGCAVLFGSFAGFQMWIDARATRPSDSSSTLSSERKSTAPPEGR